MNYTVICNQEYLGVPANYIIFLDTAIPFFCQVKSLRLFSNRSWTELWSHIWILMYPKRLQTKFLSRTILWTWIDQFSKSRPDQFPELIFLLENSLRFRTHERNNQASRHKFSGSAEQKNTIISLIKPCSPMSIIVAMSTPNSKVWIFSFLNLTQQMTKSIYISDKIL